MNNGATMPNGDTSIPPNAVSLYGQNDAMDDFPVLKAFQQYIDAEQAKAQKRMTTVCVFFALIMATVIGVFVLLLLNVGQRNSALNDQLLQFIMQDRDRQAAQNGTQGGEATMKMLTDSMAAMQKQMSEQQMKLMEQQAKLFEQQIKVAEEKVKRAVESPSPSIDPAVEAKKKQDAEKLKKAAALLAAEKEKLAKEKEALRKEKVEMHSRKLYPEYYAKQDALKREATLETEKESEPNEQTVERSEKIQTRTKNEIINSDPELQEDGSIRYFSDGEDDLPPSPKLKSIPSKQSKNTVKTVKTQSSSRPESPSLPSGSYRISGESSDVLSGWEIPLN